MEKKVGEEIIVKADKVLGTPEAVGEILEVTDYGYIVHIAGDPADEFGPVNKEGEIVFPH